MSEMSTSTSFYSSLQDSEEIRLLCLFPGSGAEVIKCSVTHVKFSDEVPYEALSYMWGPEHPVRLIAINENDFGIRENLWLALQHLRLENETRLLWIDAICINQENTDERNHQVTQMGKVYNLASRVVVWLGGSNSSSRLAFEALHPGQYGEFFNPSENLATFVDGNKKLEAIYLLLTRDYWKRLWIIQEVLMAKEFIVQCGNDTCTRFRLGWFMSLVENISETSKRSSKPPSLQILQERAAIFQVVDQSIPARLFRQRFFQGVFSATMNFSAIRERPVPRSLLALFLHFKESECQDQRDKILGLHCLGSACCREAVPPDYNLSWPEIHAKLLQHHFQCHNPISKTLAFESSPTERCQKFEIFYQEIISLSRYFLDPASDRQGRLQSFAETLVEWNDETVNINGYARGRVCYVSPPLSGRCPELPKMTAMVVKQLEYICSLESLQNPDQVPATRELDLVQLIDTSAGDDFKHNLYAFLFNPVQYSTTPRVAIHEAELNFQKIWSTACHRIRNPESCRLAFEENGLIFLTPSQTSVGDVVLQFPGSNVLAILPVRGTPPLIDRGYYRLRIHRAVSFLRSQPRKTVDICGQVMSFSHVEPNEVTMDLRLNTIRQLFRPSATLDYHSWTPN